MSTRSVLIQPGGERIEVLEGETILNAALRQGVILPYGCQDGVCGSCKAKVLADRKSVV